MCKMPTPNEFTEMPERDKWPVIYDVLCVLVRRAKLSNRILPWAFVVLVLPFCSWVVIESSAGQKRDAELDSAIKVHAIRDSLMTTVLVAKIDTVISELNRRAPRRD
jgi:hypothetical protein